MFITDKSTVSIQLLKIVENISIFCYYIVDLIVVFDDVTSRDDVAMTASFVYI